MKEQDSPILTVDELAELLKVHRSTIYRLLRKQRIPGFRIGSDWRFDKREIAAWLAKLTEIQIRARL